jgi:hypothetical protein
VDGFGHADKSNAYGLRRASVSTTLPAKTAR